MNIPEFKGYSFSPIDINPVSQPIEQESIYNTYSNISKPTISSSSNTSSILKKSCNQLNDQEYCNLPLNDLLTCSTNKDSSNIINCVQSYGMSENVYNILSKNITLPPYSSISCTYNDWSSITKATCAEQPNGTYAKTITKSVRSGPSSCSPLTKNIICPPEDCLFILTDDKCVPNPLSITSGMGDLQQTVKITSISKNGGSCQYKDGNIITKPNSCDLECSYSDWSNFSSCKLENNKWIKSQVRTLINGSEEKCSYLSNNIQCSDTLLVFYSQPNYTGTYFTYDVGDLTSSPAIIQNMNGNIIKSIQCINGNIQNYNFNLIYNQNQIEVPQNCLKDLTNRSCNVSSWSSQPPETIIIKLRCDVTPWSPGYCELSLTGTYDTFSYSRTRSITFKAPGATCPSLFDNGSCGGWFSVKGPVDQNNLSLTSYGRISSNFGDTTTITSVSLLGQSLVCTTFNGNIFMSYKGISNNPEWIKVSCPEPVTNIYMDKNNKVIASNSNNIFRWNDISQVWKNYYNLYTSQTLSPPTKLSFQVKSISNSGNLFACIDKSNNIYIGTSQTKTSTDLKGVTRPDSLYFIDPSTYSFDSIIISGKSALLLLNTSNPDITNKLFYTSDITFKPDIFSSMGSGRIGTVVLDDTQQTIDTTFYKPRWTTVITNTFPTSIGLKGTQFAYIDNSKNIYITDDILDGNKPTTDITYTTLSIQQDPSKGMFSQPGYLPQLKPKCRQIFLAKPNLYASSSLSIDGPNLVCILSNGLNTFIGYILNVFSYKDDTFMCKYSDWYIDPQEVCSTNSLQNNSKKFIVKNRNPLSSQYAGCTNIFEQVPCDTPEYCTYDNWSDPGLSSCKYINNQWTRTLTRNPVPNNAQCSLQDTKIVPCDFQEKTCDAIFDITNNTDNYDISEPVIGSSLQQNTITKENFALPSNTFTSPSDLSTSDYYLIGTLKPNTFPPKTQSLYGGQDYACTPYPSTVYKRVSPLTSPSQASSDGFYLYRSGTMTNPVQLFTRVNLVDGRNWVRVFSSPFASTATVNEIGKNIPFTGFLIQNPPRPSGGFSTLINYSYFSTPQLFNTRNSTALTTGGNKPGFAVYIGAAGGHGFYNPNLQRPCSWSNSVGLVGAGFDGNCGTFPNAIRWGWGQSGVPACQMSSPGTVWDTWITW